MNALSSIQWNRGKLKKRSIPSVRYASIVIARNRIRLFTVTSVVPAIIKTVMAYNMYQAKTKIISATVVESSHTYPRNCQSFVEFAEKGTSLCENSKDSFTISHAYSSIIW
jgi:hypothetical protein